MAYRPPVVWIHQASRPRAAALSAGQLASFKRNKSAERNTLDVVVPLGDACSESLTKSPASDCSEGVFVFPLTFLYTAISQAPFRGKVTAAPDTTRVEDGDELQVTDHNSMANRVTL